VQALERALALLMALARSDRASLTELSLRSGIPASSAHRLLMTMQADRFVAFDDTTGDWSIGVEAFRTGSSFVRRNQVTEVARDTMRGLVEQTGESANIAMPDRGEVVFVGQVESTQPIRAFFAPGVRTPMHASGIGKALLATMPRAKAERTLLATGLRAFTPRTLASPQALFEDLDRIRDRGWSVDDEERNLGMRCVAAPIFNAYGEAVAGISVSGPSGRIDADRVGEFGPMVRRAAATVTEGIGGIVPEGWGGGR
jgi:IclR family acetate operon transcriptional repressor